MSYSVNFSILLVAYSTIFETFHRLSWYCPGGQKHRIIHTCHWFRVVFGILWLLLLLCVLLFLEKRLIFLHQDVLGITVTNLTKKKGFNNVLYSARSHFRVYWTLFGVCSTISWELFNVFPWNFVHIFFITFWWSLCKKNIWELCHL